MSAAGPLESLELAAEHRVDVLVSDVVMPDLSGPEVARRLESLRPGSRTLFVSGYTVETVRGRGRLPHRQRVPGEAVRPAVAATGGPGAARPARPTTSYQPIVELAIGRVVSDSRRSCVGRIRGAGW